MREMIKIGTRGSELAIRQAEIVAERIKHHFPNINCKILTITTKGDRILDKTLDKIGGKGLFVKEIENSLLNNNIDIAVHSMKDMPGELPIGLEIGAVLEREDPRDVLVSKSGAGFFELKKGAVIGTGSLRRKMQILALRKDLEVVPIRGNINSRMKKLDEGIDGVVLAAAGLIRCNLQSKISSVFEPSEMIPAACQGILALEIRTTDTKIRSIAEKINNHDAYICAKAERAFLNSIDADCHAPVGAFAQLFGEKIQMDTMFYTDRFLRLASEGSVFLPEELGRSMGNKILNMGGLA